jgi:hypothetical protein
MLRGKEVKTVELETKAIRGNNSVAYRMLVINAKHVTAANANCLVPFLSYICNLIITRMLIKT